MSEFTVRPCAGEFRVARMESELPRIVLVIAPVPQKGALIVALVTNETEYATHRDVLIQDAESGLGYELLVETDLMVPVYNKQLDEPIGQLTGMLSGLLQPYPVDLSQIEAHRLGLPLRGPWDSRWAWKGRELEELHCLSVACFMELVS